MTSQRLKVRARIGRTPRPNQADTTAPADSDVINQAVTLAGATVELYRTTWTVRERTCYHPRALNSDDHTCTWRDRRYTGYAWRCLGCDATSHEGNSTHKGYWEDHPRESRTAANDHAATCRYAPKHPRTTGDQERAATALDIHNQHLAVFLVGLPSVLLLLILVAGLV